MRNYALWILGEFFSQEQRISSAIEEMTAVLLEHPVYSLALAVIFGMLYRRYTGRELSWIIVLSAYAPDLDIIAERVFNVMGTTILVYGEPVGHGDFHNLAFLLLYSFFVAFLLTPLGFRFWDLFVFAGAGFSAHLVEDALVFNPGYSFLWPMVNQKLGFGIFGQYQANFFGVADTWVLIWGLIFLIAAVFLRTLYERKNWWREFVISDSQFNTRPEGR